MEKKVMTARYENTGGIAIAIVASVHYHKETLLDWAAYIGGSSDTWKEETAVEAALNAGNKLRRQDAAYYFPGLPIEKYRE